ncbi:glycosyltransferase family 4 protein [Leucothrix sargassi]|nr:glycosyltransferase family 4 protein [Leucothrix sargassi]
MQKIALIINSLSSGGGERVVATLSQGFAKDYDVSIIVFEGDGIDYEYGGQLIDLKCPKKDGILGKGLNVLKRAYKLRQVFKQEKFDHIFGFMETANYPAVLASKQTIASLHIDFNFLSKSEQLLVRCIYPRAKLVAPVSDDIAETLRTQVKLSNVERIYNPVPFQELQQLASAPFSHPRKFIVAVGRLTYQKHFDLMVSAFAASKAKEDCDLIILGDGELRESLEAQIKALGMEDKILLPGRLKNPFVYMKNAEFMTLSSRAEGFPMVLIEALSLSCPAISTDCPTGPREIIQNEVNGLLIEMENQQLLTDSIDKLFYDDSLRQRLKENASDSVSHLSVENICKEWIKRSNNA